MKEKPSEEKPMKIVITFKKSERGLYEQLILHSVKAGYIKDILSKHENQQEKQESKSDVPDFSGIFGE